MLSGIGKLLNTYFKKQFKANPNLSRTLISFLTERCFIFCCIIVISVWLVDYKLKYK